MGHKWRLVCLLGTGLFCSELLWARGLKEESFPVFISLIRLRDMHFEEATQGSPPERIAALPGLFNESAAFLVKGIPNRVVNVFLPKAKVELRLHHHRSGPGEVIYLGQFESFPSEGSSINLSKLGHQLVNVGATRDRIHDQQKTGAYSGEFFITVAYQ